MSFAESQAPQPAVSHRWLSIIGIGEEGLDGLSSLARQLISGAEFVFGGPRHLALAAPAILGVARVWPNPFDPTLAEVMKVRGHRVCVLASGDPFLHGVGNTLAQYVAPREMLTIAASSAFSLAAARLAWSLTATVQISLCGRSPNFLRPHLHPGTRILALTANQQTPATVAQLLRENGFGESRLSVLECMGGARERIRTTTANDFEMADIQPLNTLAIEVIASPTARILARSSGLADELFEHDGQLTKREIRSMTLSALAPRRGDLLWDVGAGCGSIAIEWLLADTSLTAIAIEQNHARAGVIQRNAATFGVPNLNIVEGLAPAALVGLPAPEAIFIGGGATTDGVLDLARMALRPGGRLVINAVTLETELLLLNQQASHGGNLTRIAIAHASPLGHQTRYSGWRPAMPVMQWSWTR